MKEEETAKEVRDMYKKEVIQLFNQMEQFRIQCNKEVRCDLLYLSFDYDRFKLCCRTSIKVTSIIIVIKLKSSRNI